MNYYYMDGLEKKGPYTEEEIKSRNLPPETLVIKEGMTQWSTLKDFVELYHENEIQNRIHSEEKALSSNIIENRSDKKLKVSSYYILSAGILGVILLSYGIVSIQKKNDLVSFKKSINELMSGKNIISDYDFRGVDGKMHKAYFSDLLDGGFRSSIKNSVIRTDKFILAHRPLDYVKEGDLTFTHNEHNKREWEIFKDVKEYFESKMFTGFKVKKLENNGDRFYLTEIWSGDMAYKVLATKFVQGYSNEFYKSPGYEVPTYRPSIEKCYEESAKFLTVEDKDNSYEAGSYNKIDRFTDLQSDFHEITQLYPRYLRLLDSILVDNGEGGKGMMIDRRTITEQTSRNDARVFTPQWIVWYKEISNNYAVSEKKNASLKYILIYSLIGSIALMLLFYYIKYKNKIEIM
jgi:hypothetical protein